MDNVVAIGMPGGWELILILAIVLLLFGGRKIPDLARGLGEGIRNFREGVKGDDESTKGGGQIPGGSDKS